MTVVPRWFRWAAPAAVALAACGRSGPPAGPVRWRRPPPPPPALVVIPVAYDLLDEAGERIRAFLGRPAAVHGEPEVQVPAGLAVGTEPRGGSGERVA